MSGFENKPRKSSRQPVPNPLYQQSITQLKNQNPVRNNKRNKRNNDQQANSFEQERNSQINYDQSFHYNDSKDQYLTCRLPNGCQKKIKFVVELKKQQPKKKQKQYIPAYIPPKTQPPPPQTNNKKQTNLLNLFIQAFDNVDAQQQPSYQQNSIGKTPQIPIQKQKFIPIKPKRSKLDQEDYIKSVSIQNGTMKILHSYFEQVQIPVSWEQKSKNKTNAKDQESQRKISDQQQQGQEEDNLQIEQIKKKLQKCKALKNISILTNS